MGIKDSDLLILNEMSNEELEVLVRIIIDKGGFSEQLTSNNDYKNFQPDHRKYVDAIESELLSFGSHTLFFNKTYREIVSDVCNKMNIPHNKFYPIEQLEYRLLSDVLAQAWSNMSNEQRRAMLDSIGARDLEPSNASSSSILKMFQGGGGLASKFAFSAASSIAQTMLGGAAGSLSIGGLIAGGGSAMPLLTVMAGPIGIAVAAALAAVGLGGPAYRVTIPATIYISGVRYVHTHPIDEERPSFNPFGTLIEKVKHAVSAVTDAAAQSGRRVAEGAKKVLRAPSSLKDNLLRRISRNAEDHGAPPVILRRKNWIAMPNKILVGFKSKTEAIFDAAAFLLGSDGRVISDADFIFYNQPSHPSGCIVHQGGKLESFIIDFEPVPVDIKTIVLTLTSDENFKGIVNCTIVDRSARTEVRRYEFDMSDSLTTVIGEFERQGESWAFNALDESSQMQLIDVCRKFGVNAE